MTGVFGVVLGQIFLMFLYLIIGYVFYRTGLITQEGSKALAHLLLYCVLPCVVLKSFCIEYSAKGAVELAVSIAAGAGVLLLSMAVSWLFFRKDPMAQIGVAFSNAGFMGFPLVTAVLGGEAVFYAAGFVALLNALQWTYGQAKVSCGDLVSSSPFIIRTAAVPVMPPLTNLRNISVVIRDSMAAYLPVPMPSERTR